jgi:hypothetical protein
MSAASAPISMASATSLMRSPAEGPTTHQPMTRSVPTSKSRLVRPSSRARQSERVANGRLGILVGDHQGTSPFSSFGRRVRMPSGSSVPCSCPWINVSWAVDGLSGPFGCGEDLSERTHRPHPTRANASHAAPNVAQQTTALTPPVRARAGVRSRIGEAACAGMVRCGHRRIAGRLGAGLNMRRWPRTAPSTCRP